MTKIVVNREVEGFSPDAEEDSVSRKKRLTASMSKPLAGIQSSPVGSPNAQDVKDMSPIGRDINHGG